MNQSIHDATRHLEAGRRALSLGDRTTAEASFRSAVESAERSGTESEELAVALATLAQMDAAEGRMDDAAERLRRSLAIRERVLGVDHAGLIAVLQQLGTLAVTGGDERAAETYLQRALRIAELRLGAGHPELASTLNTLAQLHLRRAAYTLAEPLLRRLLAIRAAGGEERPEVATVMASLAAVHHALAEHDAAEQLRRRVLEIRERTLAPEHFAVATSLEQLAETCAARGKLEEALGHLRRALTIRVRSLEPGHPSLETVRAKITDLEMQAAQDESFGGVSSIPLPLSIPPRAAPAPAPTISPRPRAATPAGPPEAPRAAAPASDPLAALRPMLEEFEVGAQPAPRDEPHPALSLSFLQAGGAIVIPAGDRALSLPDDFGDDEYEPRAARPWPLRRSWSRRAAVGLAGAAVLLASSALALRGRGEARESTSTVPPAAPATVLAAASAALLPAVEPGPIGPAGATDSIRAVSRAESRPVEREGHPPRPASSPATQSSAAAAAAREAAIVAPPSLDRETHRALSEASSRAAALASGGLSAPTVDERSASAEAATLIAASPITASGGQVMRRATLVGEAPQPEYPAALHRIGSTGEVVLAFTVDTTGRVDLSTVRVLRATNDRLIPFARAVLPQLNFSPATMGDRRVRDAVEIPFRFTTRF